MHMHTCVRSVNTSIEAMAERLAAEVDGFITSSRRQLNLRRLSFVAFSIGGEMEAPTPSLPPSHPPPPR